MSKQNEYKHAAISLSFWSSSPLALKYEDLRQGRLNLKIRTPDARRKGLKNLSEIYTFMHQKTSLIETSKNNDFKDIINYCYMLRSSLEDAFFNRLNNLQLRFNTLRQKIDIYESNCIRNLDANKKYKSELESILEDVHNSKIELEQRLIHTNHLTDNKDIENELNKAISSLKQLSFAEQLLEKYLQKGSKLEFNETQKETSSSSLLGSMCFNTTPRYFRKVMQLNKASIFDWAKTRVVKSEIQKLKTGNFVYCYKDSNSDLVCHLIDKSGTSVKKYVFVGLCDQFRLACSQLSVFVYSTYSHSSYGKLTVLDQNLDLKKFVRVEKGLESIAVNELNLYCLGKNEESMIRVYNHDLILKREIPLNRNDPKEKFYLPNRLVSMKVYKNCFYFLDDKSCLKVVDISSGNGVYWIKVAGDRFVYLRNDKICALDTAKNELVLYDLGLGEFEKLKLDNLVKSAEGIFLMEYDNCIPNLVIEKCVAFMDLNELAVYTISTSFFL